MKHMMILSFAPLFQEVYLNMSTIIIDDNDEDLKRINCTNLEHNPPSHIVIPAGKKMVHICPGCGQQTEVRPIRITYTDFGGTYG